MANDINIKFGVAGESEFKTAVGAVNSQIKNLQAEMKAAVAGMETGADAEKAQGQQLDILSRQTDAYKQKLDILGKQYDSANKKLDELGKALEDAKREFGENSKEAAAAENAYNRQAKAVNDLGTKINQTSADMKNAEKATNDLKNGTKDAGDAAEEAGRKSRLFGQILSAEVVSSAIISGVKALAKGLKEVALGAASYADEVLTTASVSGIATDTLQEYMYMADLVDVEVGTITGSLTRLTKNMQTASKGTGEASDAFKALGIEIKGEDGQLRDANAVFNEALDRLGDMENETQRDAYAMSIFGKSARELNPLIEAGSDKIAEFAQEAHNAGYVMSSELLAANGATQDSLDRLSASFEAMKNQIGTGLAPAVTSITEGLRTLIGTLGDGGSFVDTFTGMLTGLVESISEKLPDFAEGGMKIVSELAGSLGENAPEIIAAMVRLITSAVTTMITSIPDFISGGIQLVGGIIQGVIESIPDVVSGFEEIKTTITDTIGGLVDSALQWGKDLIGNFIDGIKSKATALEEKVKSAAQTVKDFLGFSEPKRGPLSNFHTYAPDMMQLFADGIKKGIPTVEKALAQAGNAVTPAPGFDFSAFSMMAAQKQAPVEVVLNVNGTEFARATYKDFQTEANRLGEAFV